MKPIRFDDQMHFMSCQAEMLAAEGNDVSASVMRDATKVLVAERKRVRELEGELASTKKCLDKSLDWTGKKILAMTNQQIEALCRLEGHDPKDEATIAKQVCEIALLKYELEKAKRMLARPEAASATPRGWKLVPIEPTIEMENAGDKADRDYSNNRFLGLGHMGRSHFVYHFMLEAAPPEALSAEWLPMDSAPKDKRILLKWGERIECGGWELQRYHRNPKPYWSGDGEPSFGVKRYRDVPPDGWMPLPLPLSPQGSAT